MSNLKITKKKDGTRQIFIDNKNILEDFCVTNININISHKTSEATLTIPITGEIKIEDSDIFLVKKHIDSQ